MKILKSRKALSPVVASIILIAVTVAVSIAVAAWMGALSFSFMGSGEQLNVGSPYGWYNNTRVVYVKVSCPGGSAVKITDVRVNGTSYIPVGTPGLTIEPTSSTVLTVTTTTPQPVFMSGYYYQLIIVTEKNHEFQTTGLVP